MAVHMYMYVYNGEHELSVAACKNEVLPLNCVTDDRNNHHSLTNC